MGDCGEAVKTMTHKQFLEQSESEQDTFFAKLIHSIMNNSTAYERAKLIVDTCEKLGVFDNVKFGSEVYNDSEPNY